MNSIGVAQTCIVLQRPKRRPAPRTIPLTREEMMLQHDHEWRMRLLAADIERRDPDRGRVPHVRRICGVQVRFYLWRWQWYWTTASRNDPRELRSRQGFELQRDAIKDAVRTLHHDGDLRRKFAEMDARFQKLHRRFEQIDARTLPQVS